MARILILCGDDGFVASLREWLGEEQIEASRGEECAGRIEADDVPDAVVVGPGAVDPIATAQRARSLAADSSILIAVPEARLELLRRDILFAPFLGLDVHCHSSEDPAGLAGNVAAGASRTRRRRQHRLALHTVGAQLPSSPVSHGAAGDFGQLLAEAPLGVLTVDGAGFVLGFNRRAAEILELAEWEIRGRRAWELFPEGGREALRELFVVRPVRAEAGTCTLEIDGTSGAPRAVEATVSTLPAGPSEARFLVFLQDITRRIRAERERRELLEAEREARAQAERASQARQELLQVVSHDLRSPLTGIFIHAAIIDRALARAGLTDSPTARSVMHITRAAERMNRLILDLLDATNLETGRLAITLKPQPAGALLEESCEAFQPQAGEKAITLRVEPPAGAVVVRCDRGRILQVLANLVGNALKFTAAGGLVTLRARPREAEVLFSVADTGPGIPDGHLPHIFERYWQGERGGYHGIGLGLAIAKGIVEAHGGRIWAESAVGVGATFYFTLEAIRPPDSAARA